MNYCINCGVKLGWLDRDPNGDKDCVCAKCKAEDRHDFDAEPNAEYDRAGRRIVKNLEKHSVPCSSPSSCPVISVLMDIRQQCIDNGYWHLPSMDAADRFLEAMYKNGG